MACIYLGMKNGSNESNISSSTKVKVNVTKKIFTECINFEKVTYKITYPEPYENKYISTFFGSYYNVLIYNGYNYKNRGDLIFGYYSPSNNNQILREVCVYYSILRDYLPLIVTFTTRENVTHICTYEMIKSAKWFYASKIKEYVLKGNLVTELPKEQIRSSRRRKIIFKTDIEKNKNINELNELKVGRKYKRVTFIPNRNSKKGGSVTGPYELSSKELFKPNSLNNKIDEEFLKKVKERCFDGIILYYTHPSDIALLIEFIVDCSTKEQYVRSDIHGNVWEKKSVSYKDEKELIKELQKIKNQYLGRNEKINLGSAPINFNNTGGNVESSGGNKTINFDDDEAEDIDIELNPTPYPDDDYEDDLNTPTIGNIILYILCGSTLLSAIIALIYYKFPRFLATLYRRFI